MQRRGLVASAFRKLLIVLAGTLALEGADFPQQLRTNREILCPEVRSALPLDGDTEQKAWKSLPWSEGFIVLDSLWVSSPVKTAVALARDADYLYVGMRMAEPEMKNLKKLVALAVLMTVSINVTASDFGTWLGAEAEKKVGK